MWMFRWHSRQQPQRAPVKTVEMVDHAGTAHFLTIDAAERGLPLGKYMTLCASEIQPAALVAEMTRYCRLCLGLPVPTQRGAR
jgi:hypothetical protein